MLELPSLVLAAVAIVSRAINGGHWSGEYVTMLQSSSVLTALGIEPYAELLAAPLIALEEWVSAIEPALIGFSVPLLWLVPLLRLLLLSPRCVPTRIRQSGLPTATASNPRAACWPRYLRQSEAWLRLLRASHRSTQSHPILARCL